MQLHEPRNSSEGESRRKTQARQQTKTKWPRAKENKHRLKGIQEQNV